MIKTDGSYKQKGKQKSRSTISPSKKTMPSNIVETSTILSSTITEKVEERGEKMISLESGVVLSIVDQLEERQSVASSAGEVTTLAEKLLGPFEGQGNEIMRLDYCLEGGVMTSNETRQTVTVSEEIESLELNLEKERANEGRESGNWSSNPEIGEWYTPSPSMNSGLNFESVGWEWENGVENYEIWDGGIDMLSWFWGSGI